MHQMLPGVGSVAMCSAWLLFSPDRGSCSNPLIKEIDESFSPVLLSLETLSPSELFNSGQMILKGCLSEPSWFVEQNKLLWVSDWWLFKIFCWWTTWSSSQLLFKSVDDFEMVCVSRSLANNSLSESFGNVTLSTEWVFALTLDCCCKMLSPLLVKLMDSLSLLAMTKNSKAHNENFTIE